ncbi:uracil-DNA glycosylase superfamily [Nitrospirillum viridazoti Y2]|nr:uracil-DNA glycosylase superfamily [Nitrospirillum amazonense Y2]
MSGAHTTRNGRPYPMTQNLTPPGHDCPLCPRLVDYRLRNRAAFPDKFNRPVPSFGGLNARLLVVGLAPGLRGANFSGRPFTGDYAGDLLYATLLKFGFATGQYLERPDDGLTLVDARITNAVRCVPPENKPTPEESHTCRPFLVAELEAMTKLKAVVALGSVSHTSVIRTFGLRQAAHPFGHGAQHDLGGGVTLFDSYHCSRYNTNTGRLTDTMFEDVFKAVRQYLGT